MIFDVSTDDDPYRNGTDNPNTIEEDRRDYADCAEQLGMMIV